MAPAVINPAKGKAKVRQVPRILVVDDEPSLIELVNDVVSRSGESYKIYSAMNLEQARAIIDAERIDLLLADVSLPDGDGTSLLSVLRARHSHAAAVVITGNPSMNGAIDALRAGFVDFLPKPFSAEHLIERIRNAIERQALAARKEVRLVRLRDAVKKLNLTRHMISKKVDLLCNDLVSAYGELSRQFDTVRLQEGFRKLLDSSNDLEQMLCHAMDWILRNVGYCNVAVWLAAEEDQFELGAYMKYTIAGEPELTDAMARGILKTVVREGSVHLFGPELKEHLTPAEFKLLARQEILGCNCTYLGESLAGVVLFRDEKSPFTEDDEAMIRAISPIFAVALADMVRRSQGEEGDEADEYGENGGSILDEEGGPSSSGNGNDRSDGGNGNGGGGSSSQGKSGRNDKPAKRERKPDAADWWKRGEPPPF